MGFTPQEISEAKMMAEAANYAPVVDKAALSANYQQQAAEEEADAKQKHGIEEGYAKNERFLAEGDALSASQIHLTGAGSNKGVGPEDAGKNKKGAKRSDDGLYLSALQAQIDALEDDIAQLDGEIEDILAPYLSAEEQAYLDGIDDPAEKAREQMRIAREKLANGEMTQAEFDRFKERWEERQAKRAEHDRVDNIMGNGLPEQIMEAAQNEEIEAVQLSRDATETETRDKVETTLNERDKVGRTDQQNTEADFSVFQEGGSLGAEGAQVSLLGGGSVASQIMPGDNPNVKMPSLKAEFVSAHGVQEEMEPSPRSEEPKAEEDSKFVAKGIDAPGYPAG